MSLNQKYVSSMGSLLMSFQISHLKKPSEANVVCYYLLRKKEKTFGESVQCSYVCLQLIIFQLHPFCAVNLLFFITFCHAEQNTD